MKDLRQAQDYAEYMASTGWEVATVGGQQAYLKFLPLLPISILKLQRVGIEEFDATAVDAAARKCRVVRRYVELFEERESAVFDDIIQQMKHRGFAPTGGLLPTKTRLVDLRLGEEALLEQMHHKTRYNIRRAKRDTMQVEVLDGTALLSAESLKDTLALLVANAKRVGFWGVDATRLTKKLKAFGERAFGVLVRKSDSSPPLAAGLYWSTQTRIYYGANGSSREGRQLHAPTLVVWEGMREGKRRGLTEFDFGGEFDERYPLKRWKGFSRFKRSFGGRGVYYPPAFARWG